MKKKNFKLGVGKYYFNIRNGQQTILITRGEKSDAVYTFLSYLKNGKDCEWLGCWNGKSFDETQSPAAA